MDNMPKDNMPSSGPAPVSPLPAKSARVQMGALPKGTKIGDTVEMTVTDIDPTTNMVTLSSGPDAQGDTPDTGSTDESSEAVETNQDSPTGKPMDSSLLLGPMSNFKSYLARKSVDSSMRQG